LSKYKKLVPVKLPAKIGFLSFMGDIQGCGVIRVITPYNMIPYMNMPKLKINSSYIASFIGDINFFKNFTFVQFQRSATKTHLQIHRDFRKRIQPKAGVPLFYEIDDLLLHIPKWNYAHQYYVKNNPYIELMLKESNGIITSTHSLKKEYSKYNNNIAVIENHLPKYIWGDIEPRHNEYKEENKVRILWAGSQNHFKHPGMVSAPDGGDFGTKLMKFIRKTVDKYDWHFMGAMPTELDDIKDKIIFHKWKDTWHYPKYIKSIKADMGIAPLEKNIFNDCKSNIKSLEFTACGMPGVYSDVDPYKWMSIKCKTDDQIISQIETLADDVDLRAKTFKKDYSMIKNQLWWEENGNLKKYINSYLSLMGRKLPKGLQPMNDMLY
jgi:O-antigen biosynthesis protein